LEDTHKFEGDENSLVHLVYDGFSEYDESVYTSGPRSVLSGTISGKNSAEDLETGSLDDLKSSNESVASSAAGSEPSFVPDDHITDKPFLKAPMVDAVYLQSFVDLESSPGRHIQEARDSKGIDP
jgi:hypothetical protein